MNFTDLIKTLQSNPKFRIMGEDLEKWKNVPKNLTGLDLILKNFLVKLDVKKSNVWKEHICSSNFELVRRIDDLFPNRIQRLHESRNPFDNRNISSSILTFSFDQHDFLSILSKNEFRINGFVSLRKENIDILIEIVEKLLKRNGK